MSFKVYHGINDNVFTHCDTAYDAYLAQEKVYFGVVRATRGCGSRVQDILDREYKYLVRVHELLSEDEKREEPLPKPVKSINDGGFGFTSGLNSISFN